MNILVACEESQRVTAAFRAFGHEAFSCDIVMTTGVRNRGCPAPFSSGVVNRGL